MPAAVLSLLGGTALADESAAADRVAAFESARLMSLVRNLRPIPHWIGRSDRFWVRSETPDGVRFIVVDAASGRQSPAFDHAAMAGALTAAGEVVDAAALPIRSIDLAGESIRVDTAGGSFGCSVDASSCERRGVAGSSSSERPSPGGNQILFVRDRNLWLRDAGSGRQRQLTDDGVDGFAYGSLGADLSRVERRRQHQPSPLMSANWSPDGRYVAAMRVDLGDVPLRPVVTEHLPPDDTFAITHLDRVIVAADRIAPARRIAVVDTRTGKMVVSDIDPGKLHDFAPLHFASNNLWWNLRAGKVFFVTATHGGQRYGIAEMDLATGHTRAVVEESEEHYYAFNARDYDRPNFHVTSDGKDAIFYSQRSGAGHLYLYDAVNGQLRNAITRGPWVVFDLIRVDERNRQVYFTAGGREKGRDPYYPHLYRVSFDGSALELLTPEDAAHEFHTSGLPIVARGEAQSQFSPSGRYFVDVFSTLEQAPVMVVRRADGKLISKVLTADISALERTGWQPPQRFVVKAADGETDLYGAMFRPGDFDPNLSYAVVDQTYPGPQTNSAPHSFVDNFAAITTQNAQAMAQVGLVVVALDGRGTTRRDRAFRYAFAGTRDVFGAADHKAAIENLAARFAYLDATRVGITGASFGGQGSLRAALLYPDFFHAVVSHVAPHESLNSAASTISVERFLGVPGTRRDFYDETSNIAIIGNLQADLMLVYGEVDENVPLRAAMTIYDALMKADKDFTTYVVPDADHAGAFSHPYVVKRQRRFFLDHLGGPAPRREAATRHEPGECEH